MTTKSNKFSKTLIATLSILLITGFGAAQASGTSGGSVSPNLADTSEAVTLSVTAEGVDTSDGTTGATITFQLPTGAMDSNTGSSSVSVSGSTTAGTSSLNTGNDQVTVTFDDNSGSGTENIDVSLDVNNLEEVSSNPVTVSVDSNSDDTNEISGDQIGSLEVDGTAPTFDDVEVTASNKVRVDFSEGVYSSDGSGPLESADFTYQDDNSGDGATALSTTITHNAGDASATLTLDTDLDNSDLTADDIVINDNIFDAAGNSINSGTTQIDDTSGDEVRPSITGATVSDTAQQKMTVNFDEPIDASDATGYSVTTSDTTSISVTGIDSNSVSGSNSLTLTLDRDAISSETLTLDYDGGSGTTDSDGSNLNTQSFNQEITNNVVNTDQNVVNSDTLKDFGAGGDTIVVQNIKVEDTDSDGIDTTVNEFNIDNAGSATASDISSVTIEDDEGNVIKSEVSVGSLPVTVSSSLSNNVVADGGSETFVVKATLDSAPTDANTLEFSTDVQVTEDAEGRTLTADDTTADEIDLKPQITGATTADSNNNGQIDQVKVDFSEAVNVGSAFDGVTGLSIGTAGEYTIDELDSSNDQSSLTFSVDESGSSDTGATPDVEYNTGNSELTDSDQQNKEIAAHGPTAATDGAAPVATSAAYRDSNNDGTVDKVDIDFSETVDYTASNTPSDDWSITPNGVTNLAVESTQVSSTQNGVSTVTVDVTADSDITGTASNEPTIDYGQSGDNGVFDQASSSNEAVSSSPVTATDEAAPSFKSVTTVDSEPNGKLDGLTVEFTEAVADDSVETADLSIESANGLSGSIAGVSGNGDSDSTVTVDLSEGISTDTGATPTLDYSEDGSNAAIQDSSSNEMADQPSDAAADTSAPVLMNSEIDHDGSTSSVTQVDLKFSETIGTGTGDVLTDQTDVALNVGSSPSSDVVTATAEESGTDTVLQTGDSPKVTDASVLGDGQSNSAELFESSNVQIDTFRKDLSSGWNFVSFPIADSTSPSLDSVLDMDKVDVVWEYDSDGWTSSNDDLSTVEAGQGYLVNASSDHTIAPNVNNVVSNEGAQVSSPGEFELQAGWNLVGQYQEFNQDADAESNDQAAFRTVGSSNFNTVYRQTSPGNLAGITDVGGNSGVMKTGEAFWVQTTGKIPAGSLVYSEN